MTPRERLLATLRHGMADRLPWAPKFGTWFRARLRRGDLPPALEGCAHWHDAARRIGVDIFDKSGAVTRTVTPSVRTEEAYRIAASSPAEVLLTGENTNSDFESPELFRRYAFPTFRRASEVAHAAGKLSWIHACGKLKVLLPQFAEAGIDGVESLTPPPYADTELPAARAAWRGAITIDGGVSPHLLVGARPPGELRRALLELLAAMGDGRNFVLSVSDDTPTDALLERLVEVNEIVREHGALPLRRAR